MSVEMDNEKWQSLEDQGWTNMSTILDEKMPTKKRRGLIWLLLAGLLLLTSIAGIAYAQRLHRQESQPQASDSSVEMALKGKSSSVTSEEQEDAKDKIVFDRDNVKKAASLPAQISSPTEEALNTHQEIATANNMPRADQLEPEPVSTATAAVQEDQKKAEDPQASSAASAPARVVTEDGWTPLSPLLIRWSSIHSMSQRYAVSSQLAQIKGEIVRDDPKRIHVDLHAGLSSDFGFESMGVHGGAWINYRFSKKVSIVSGLRAYRIQQPFQFTATRETLDNGTIEVQQNSDQIATPQNDLTSVRQQEFSLNVADAHTYLQIPLQVHYRLSNHWDFYGGAAWLRRFAGGSSNDLVLEVAPTMVNDLNRQNTPEVFKQSNFSAVTGVNYRWRKFGIGLEAGWLSGNQLNYTIDPNANLSRTAKRVLNRIHLQMLFRL